jgi:hypothetical protein
MIVCVDTGIEVGFSLVLACVSLGTLEDGRWVRNLSILEA